MPSLSRLAPIVPSTDRVHCSQEDRRGFFPALPAGLVHCSNLRRVGWLSPRSRPVETTAHSVTLRRVLLGHHSAPSAGQAFRASPRRVDWLSPRPRAGWDHCSRGRPVTLRRACLALSLRALGRTGPPREPSSSQLALTAPPGRLRPLLTRPPSHAPACRPCSVPLGLPREPSSSQLALTAPPGRLRPLLTRPPSHAPACLFFPVPPHPRPDGTAA